jgi:biotin carboxyl carrier protein
MAMASLDLDLVRHALKTAQEHGFAEVELGLDGATFRARFEPGHSRATKAKAAGDTRVPMGLEQEPMLIKSPIVGYYRTGAVPLVAGGSIEKGDMIAVINALGIANDVESQFSGEIAEVFIEDGQSVEFGQVLAKVKP